MPAPKPLLAVPNAMIRASTDWTSPTPIRAALVLVGPAVILASCSTPTASVSPLVAGLGISGDLSIQGTAGLVGTAQTSSNFDELGVGDDEVGFGGTVRIGFAGAELSVAGLGVDFSGEGVSNSSFEFEGTTINAGTNVDTDIGLRMARGLFTWDILPIPGIDLGIGIGATLIDLDFELRDQLTGVSIETDQLIPVPLIGARAAWTWGPVDLRADVGGLVAEFDGDEATVIDGEVSATIDVLASGSLTAGYRITSIDAEYEDSNARVETDFELDWFFVGLRLGF